MTAQDRGDVLRFFDHEHLPPHLRDVARPFCELAELVAHLLPDHPQADRCLEKLLEAKDCAVRAELAGEQHDP